MNSLALQRCLHHGTREAVARCPECGHSYCRECIVEHEERVLCAGCVKKILSRSGRTTNIALKILRGAHVALGFMVLWLFFFALGRILLAIPTSFHEGEIWKNLHLP